MSGLVLDLFAGAGGWDVGARWHDIDPLGLELDAATCATRAAAGLRTVRMDVSQMSTAPLAGRLDGLVASPPCQAFSMAGKRAGKRDMPLVAEAIASLARGEDRRAELAARAEDPVSLLVVEPLRFALTCRPRWCAWEQVPPVLPVWEACAARLRDVGYLTYTGILNAADQGVPQTRRRAFLVARYGGPVFPPAPTHSRNGGPDLFGELLPWVSMAEALGLEGVDRPARAVCGNRAPRWAYGPGGASYGTGWTLGTHSGNGDAHDYARGAEHPSPVVSHRVNRWELHTNRDQREDGSRQVVGVDTPAPSLTGKSGGQWELRTKRTTERAGGRHPDVLDASSSPARTVAFVRDPTRSSHRDVSCATVRAGDELAPTLFFGHQQGDVRWFHARPATTLTTEGYVYGPHSGHQGEPQSHDSVRIEPEDAAVLQGFPRGYPWRGTRTAVFSQIGNAVPPPLAAAVIAAASGCCEEGL